MSDDDGSPVVVDCRWLNYTGIGRVTALVLQGLGERGAPPWTYWGAAPLPVALPEQAGVSVSSRPPTSGFGQLELGPSWRSGVRVSLHAVRPLLVRSRSVVLLHDVIPAVHEPSPLKRALWKRYFETSIRQAERLMVYSAATADRARDFGVDERTLRRIEMTIDPTLALRCRERRGAVRPGKRYLLYVGQVKPHKNLARAIEGFRRSTFRRDGGSFVIVGATEAAALSLRAAVADGETVDIRGRCSDEELEDLLVGASALILPSLEEGFGLPVLEAQVAGVPALCSDIEAHREHAAGDVTFFDPYDHSSIAEAIDVATAAPPPAVPKLISPAEFAEQIVKVVDELR